MNIELIKAPHRARPFRAFAIHTASGESYAVKHPENLMITADGSGVIVSPVGGQVAMIDVGSVTEVTYDFNRQPAQSIDT